MDHTSGKFCYKGIGPFRHGRAILLQAIHDERDPARAHELKAEFFSLEDKSIYRIRLPLHCNYVSLPLGQADWHSAFYTDVHHLHDLQGYNIHVGAGASISPKATILDDAKGERRLNKLMEPPVHANLANPVSIGRDTLLAPDVKIYTTTHVLHPDERLRDTKACMEYQWPVTIGDNCWIEGGATICPGVTIGNLVTVAAGAVVTKDVEHRCLVAGMPARVIRRW
jgi:acetyltransferase-like isoleucine patch superfamily enzyme